jgi:hypothetical protein
MLHSLRSVLVVIVGGVGALIVADRLVSAPGFINPRDFLEYWAAGAANVRGGNPYDAEELLRWQQQADPDRTGAVMMWNPPWSLAVYMPLGLLPPRWATLFWIGTQLLAVIAACDWLWHVYEGPARWRWVGPAVGVSFAPVVWAVLYGQNTGLVLLGLAGFAHFRLIGRPALAGGFAALTALKPHLLAVFGVLLVLDAFSRPGRIALATGAGVIVAALGLVVLANPAVLGQYVQVVRYPGPGAVPLDQWVLPVASYWLRVGLRAGFWVQFVPCGVACLVYGAYRLAQGARWDWSAQLPWVVWASVLTTPYGGWIFDLTVLLVPVIAVAAGLTRRCRWALTAVLAVGHLAITTMTLVGGFTLPGFFWVAPTILGLCVWAVVTEEGATPSGGLSGGHQSGPAA